MFNGASSPLKHHHYLVCCFREHPGTEMRLSLLALLAPQTLGDQAHHTSHTLGDQTHHTSHTPGDEAHHTTHTVEPYSPYLSEAAYSYSPEYGQEYSQVGPSSHVVLDFFAECVRSRHLRPSYSHSLRQLLRLPHGNT